MFIISDMSNEIPLPLFVALVVGTIGLYYLRQWFKGGVCTSKKRLDGKTVVITGCNVGIGKETALELSKRGARVLMACRNTDAAAEAANEIRRATKGLVMVYKLDLASLKSVRECAEEINACEKKIDILINNAGIMMCPYMKTEEGFEMQMGTNHFGHFLFTMLLLDKIKAAHNARIITLSSLGHRFGMIDFDDMDYEKTPYNSTTAYGRSKLANILFTRELAKKLKGTGVTCYAVHPGAVRTELARHVEDFLGPFKAIPRALYYYFSKSPKEGAQTSLHCALDDQAGQETGLYYSDCRVKTPQPSAQDDEVARKLWDYSAKAVGL